MISWTSHSIAWIYVLKDNIRLKKETYSAERSIWNVFILVNNNLHVAFLMMLRIKTDFYIGMSNRITYCSNISDFLDILHFEYTWYVISLRWCLHLKYLKSNYCCLIVISFMCRFLGHIIILLRNNFFSKELLMFH